MHGIQSEQERERHRSCDSLVRQTNCSSSLSLLPMPAYRLYLNGIVLVSTPGTFQLEFKFRLKVKAPSSEKNKS